MAIEQQSKNQVLAALRRARSQIANVKEEAKAIGGRALNTGLTVGSGALVGISRKKWGEGAKKRLYIPGTEVDADLVVGTLTALLGISGVTDEMSDSVAAIGGGTLAGWAAIETFQD